MEENLRGLSPYVNFHSFIDLILTTSAFSFFKNTNSTNKAKIHNDSQPQSSPHPHPRNDPWNNFVLDHCRCTLRYKIWIYAIVCVCACIWNAFFYTNDSIWIYFFEACCKYSNICLGDSCRSVHIEQHFSIARDLWQFLETFLVVTSWVVMPQASCR